MLHRAGRINDEIVAQVQKFIAENTFDPSKQIEQSPAKKVRHLEIKLFQEILVSTRLQGLLPSKS